MTLFKDWCRSFVQYSYFGKKNRYYNHWSYNNLIRTISLVLEWFSNQIPAKKTIWIFDWSGIQIPTVVEKGYQMIVQWTSENPNTGIIQFPEFFLSGFQMGKTR
jgi:hypothetical protein